MKLYNRKEVGEILKKAADSSLSDESDSLNGLSLDELKQIASETGIDPEQITRAAAELEITGGRNETTFWGGPFIFNSQVLAEGEITDQQWEEMLISIQKFFQSKGEVSERKSVSEWSSPWGTTNAAQVTALKDNGKTKISVNWTGPLTAIPFYIPVPIAAILSLLFASGFLGLGSVSGIAFTLLATSLTFLAGRWALQRHMNKAYKKLRQFVAELNLIANKKNENAEQVSNPNDTSQSSSNTKQPLVQIEILEEQTKDDKLEKPVSRQRDSH